MALFDYSALEEMAKQDLDSLDLERISDGLGVRKQPDMKADTAVWVSCPPLYDLPVVKLETPGFDFHSKEKDVAIYVHVPFCSGRCFYCGFHKEVSANLEGRPDCFDEYIEAVELEFDLMIEASNLAERNVRSVYIGGGTPTLLGPKAISRILSIPYRKLKIEENAEITVEAHPSHMESDVLSSMLEAGANRISIGVQTFNDDLLRKINRRHTCEDAVEAIKRSVSAGFENINIDLMRSLPYQTPTTFADDLVMLQRLGIPSVTFYELLIKPDTHFADLYRDDRGLFPGEKEGLLLYSMAKSGLTDIGYTEYPLDWFVLDQQKFVHRQQLQKWFEFIDLVGFGPSAYSLQNGVRYYNIRNTSKYIDTVKKGTLPIHAGRSQMLKELMYTAMIFGLNGKFDKNRFSERFGLPVREVFGDLISKLKRLELLEDNDDHISLSRKGSFFKREIQQYVYEHHLQKQSTPLSAEGAVGKD